MIAGDNVPALYANGFDYVYKARGLIPTLSGTDASTWGSFFNPRECTRTVTVRPWTSCRDSRLR